MVSSKNTIANAAITALEQHGSPMLVEEIYNFIVLNNVYQFKAKKPLSVLKSEIRKRTVGISTGASSQVKFFQLMSDGTFWLKDKSLS